MITFDEDDFKKLEIRIGKVVSVEKISDTDKLLKFVREKFLQGVLLDKVIELKKFCKTGKTRYNKERFYD